MKNLISLNRSGMSPDGMSRKGRHAIGSNLSRLCLASLICLCMLTVGVGNAWGANATMTGGTNATASTFSSASGYKCGTGKAGGSMTVTIPANATVLSVYIAAWNGESPSVSISRSSGTISSSSVSPSSDSGISGSGTSYTLANAESTYLQTFTLSNVGSETTVTFSTSAKNKRFGVWGAKICYSPTFPTNTTIGSTTATLGWSDAKNVNSYEVYYSTSSTPPTASSSGTTTTSKSINLTSLTSSQQYYWWVRAYDSYCKSAWVAGSSFTTTSGASCADPSAPGNSSVSGTGVTISTSSSSANYDIYYSTSSTTPTTQDPTATISSGNSKAITGLSYGTTYYYWMRKNCGGGSTSSWVAGSPTTFTTTVPAPTGVSAGSLTMDGATFTITDANDVNNYDIYYSTNSTAPVAGTTPSTTSTSKTKAVSGLAAGTYYYWVRAKGPNAKSDWVGGSTFTTLTLSSIAVSTAPTKTKYLVGDNFDPTALVITRTYSNSTSDTYSYAGHTSEFTFSPATNAALTAGDDAVTITYGGKSVSQSINVYSVTVNKVDMDGNAIADAGVTASCSGRTLSQSVGSTNYKFNSWVLATASGTSLSTNTLTGTPTGNVVVNAKFHKPITVTWKVGSGAASGGTSEVKYGTAISALPSTPADNALASCGTNKFMGWTALGELKGTGNDAPADLFTTVGGAANLTTNTTYRAVFASSTSGAAANTVLFEEPFTGMTADTKPTSPGSSATVYGSATITYTFTNGTGTSSGTTAIKNEALTQSGSAPEVMVGKKGTSSGAAGGTVVITGIPNGGASALTVSYTQNANGLSATASGTGYSGSTSGNSKTDKSFDVTVSSNADPTLTLTFQATSTSNVRLDDIKVKVKTAGTTAVDYQTGCCEAPPALSITSANSVATGGTVSLTSTGGNGGTVTWSVVNGSGTATVAGTTLTAGSIGTVTVKAHQDANTVLGTEYCAQDAEQAFTVVSSTIHVTGVEVSPTTKAIVPGETFDITPTISPSNATDKSVSWTSSASDKASVSSGTVTGVAAGTATITCTTTDGSKTATTAVTVYGVTMQALDEDGNAIAVGGPGTPSRSGASISPAADAGNYVFKEWAISGASLGSSASTKANTITNPTGAVTVTAKYYKPRVVKWSVNGNDSYTAGGATTAVAYNGTITTVPSDPSGLACASTFVAWTDAAHNNGQTAKDDDSYYESKLFTDAGDFPNITAETTTFYAVFAEKTNSDGYKYIGDDGTLADGKKYIFVNAKSAGSAYALKATDLAAPNSGNNGTAVSVTVTSNAEGVLVTTVNTDLEFEYVSSGTKLKYEVDGPATRYLFINGDGVGMKSDDSRSRYTTDAGLQGWNNKVTSYYDVYYNSTNEKFEKKESADSRVYAFIKQTATYGNYVTECDANIVSVTYDANGGATSCANTTTDKTEDFTVCSSAPTRDYYTFAGWLCSADDKVYAASATIDDAVIDADFSLTAQWTPVNYSISYNLNGGTNAADPIEEYNVETVSALPTPTKGQDRFDGWFTDNGVWSNQVASITAGMHGDLTLYAKWTSRNTIIFEVDGSPTTIYRANDENLEDAVAGQGSKPDEPDAPSACSSKVFVGWSESTIDDETDTRPGDLTNATGTVNSDKHYYAVWALQSGTPIAAVEDNSFTTSGIETYCGMTNGMKDAGDYILKNSIWTSSNMSDVQVKIKVYHLSNKTADVLRISLVNSSGVEVVGTDLSTTAFGTSSSSAAYSSYVTLTPTSSVTGYKVALKTKNSNGACVDKVTREVVSTYSAYSTSCCATKVTLSQNSPSNGTIAFGKTTVPTCGEDKNVSLTITPAAGYQLHSYEVATGGGKVATKSVSPAIALDNNSSAAQNITLTFAKDANGAYDVTASFTKMAPTAWEWTYNSAAIPNPINLYVGQTATLNATYTPSGLLNSEQDYDVTKSANLMQTSKTYATPDIHYTFRADAAMDDGTVTLTNKINSSLTTTVHVHVDPLPRVHFVDLVHGKEFADVVATIAENALNPNKTTKTSVDWVTPNANDCESDHLHLVGWIRSDWPALVAYLNGTGDAPTTTAIVGAGNDGAGHAYYFAAGASINVQIFDGVTFYAVWAEIK